MLFSGILNFVCFDLGYMCCRFVALVCLVIVDRILCCWWGLLEILLTFFIGTVDVSITGTCFRRLLVLGLGMMRCTVLLLIMGRFMSSTLHFMSIVHCFVSSIGYIERAPGILLSSMLHKLAIYLYLRLRLLFVSMLQIQL